MILHPALGIIARRAAEGQLTQAARPTFPIIIVDDSPFEELKSRYFKHILARLSDNQNNEHNRDASFSR
jgi:hypothetical protein